MGRNRFVRERVSWWLPAVAIVAASWLVFALAQSFPTLCALAFPCPPADVRVMPALMFGVMQLVPLTVVIVACRLRSPARWVIPAAYAVLVVLAVIGYGAVVFSGGFAVDAPFLIGLAAVCGTAWLGILGSSMSRRVTRGRDGGVAVDGAPSRI